MGDDTGVVAEDTDLLRCGRKADLCCSACSDAQVERRFWWLQVGRTRDKIPYPVCVRWPVMVCVCMCVIGLLLSVGRDDRVKK